MAVYLLDGSVLLDGGSVATSEDCCCEQDCSSCDDLPPVGSPPPTHINVTRTISGTCTGSGGSGTLTGTVTYDRDLGFALVGPSGGHIFCAHNIFTSDGVHNWSGHFFCNGSVFYERGGGVTLGFGGLLGRDVITCEWWFEMDGFLPSSCGDVSNCGLSFASIFEMIASPGDPSGVYNFTETLPGGFTLDTVVTIT